MNQKGEVQRITGVECCAAAPAHGCGQGKQDDVTKYLKDIPNG